MMFSVCSMEFWVCVCILTQAVSLVLADTLALRWCVRALVLTTVEWLRFSADVLEVAGDAARYALGLMEAKGCADRVIHALLIGGAVCSAYSALLLCDLVIVSAGLLLSECVPHIVTVCTVVDGVEACH
jgi:hypothetical protein